MLALIAYTVTGAICGCIFSAKSGFNLSEGALSIARSNQAVLLKENFNVRAEPRQARAFIRFRQDRH